MFRVVSVVELTAPAATEQSKLVSEVLLVQFDPKLAAGQSTMPTTVQVKMFYGEATGASAAPRDVSPTNQTDSLLSFPFRVVIDLRC